MPPDHSRFPPVAGGTAGSTSFRGERSGVSRITVPRITVDDVGWRRSVRGADVIARRAALAAGGTDSVVLTSDRTVRLLNARHRGRNKPTNVLTFDTGGEVILAHGVVRREAKAAGRRTGHHLAHLVVHGALHLQGHDHHHPGEARRMEMAETRILRRLGLPNPWRSA
jgi:probable rRNA maturation factor